MYAASELTLFTFKKKNEACLDHALKLELSGGVGRYSPLDMMLLSITRSPLPQQLRATAHLYTPAESDNEE